MKKRYHQIELFMKYPIEVQREVFDRLIRKAKGTEWGLQYGYADITSPEVFRERVPLQTYEEIKPYMLRLKAGEQKLLWPTEINWFAKSSGTTADKSKFIPVSKEALEDCHYKGGKDLLALYSHSFPNHNLYGGKSLVMGGSSSINELRKDSYYGDLSAIIINNLPFWVEFKRIPDRSIALMDEWEEKIEVMARSVMHEDVTNMAGVPSWTLVLLKRILEITGKDHITQLWPNLELFIHGGVSFEPYRSQFKALIPSAGMHYYESYNASEGYFGIQDLPERNDMLLMLDYGIYYEFIPAAEAHREQPPTIGLRDVEIGENYEMVISTNAGLWRYRLGDTVEFTTKNPFRIRVTGRTKHFINAFGEELIIDNAERALVEACEKNRCSLSDYTAGPIYMSDDHSGGHEWLIEFKNPPESLEKFTGDLDTALKKVNSDYEAKRTADLTLGMPVVRAVPPGTFYKWLKSKGKLGGQNKIPRLANNREYLEHISELAFPVHK